MVLDHFYITSFIYLSINIHTIVSSTSGHNDMQRVHNVVQEKDSYIAQLICKLHKNKETISGLQKQLEQSNQHLMSSRKTTGTI